MNYALRIPEATYDEVTRHVAQQFPNEAGALFLVGRVRNADSETLLARRALLLDRSSFDAQESYQLIVKPAVINSIISLCEANGLGVVFCHSHPVDVPYSPTDDAGEARLKRVFDQCLPDLPFGSLLLCPGMTLGRVWISPTQWEPITSLRVIGAAVQTVPMHGSPASVHSNVDAAFDRQVRALGSEGQRKISETRVAVVGLGGTGSPTAEQLIRLGVRDLLLIDRDVVDETTLTRVYGTFRRHVRATTNHEGRGAACPPTAQAASTPSSGPKSKVSAIAEHLRGIAPDCNVQAVFGDVVESRSARLLLDRDIVFSCLDEDWGRAVINQIAYQYLIPAINVGVRIDVDDTGLLGAAGSVQTLAPGKACLWCAGSISSERIRAESLPEQERTNLEKEKYVVGLNTRAPSVISLTTTLSALAVTQFLQLVTGFLGSRGSAARLNYFITESVITPGEIPVRVGCICGRFLARGDFAQLPSLEQRVA